MTASPNIRGDKPQASASAEAAERYVIALTQDAALAAALQELAAGDVTVQRVEDLRGLADQLMQHEAAIALLDAQALGVPADAAVDAVKGQFPDVRLLVAGHGGEQNLLAGRIADQKVFRFVHKPASAQRLQRFVDAAAQAAAPPAAAVQRPPATDAARPAGDSRALPLLVGIAGALVLAVGGWLLLRGTDTAAPAGASPTTAPQAGP